MLTIDLGLPDRISHPPEPGEAVKDEVLLRVGTPIEKRNDNQSVDDSPQQKYGHPAGEFNDMAECV